MATLLVGNIEKDDFEKQSSERVVFTVDFAEELGSSGSISSYSIHAVNSSGTSVDTTVLGGYSQSGSVLTVGAKAGESGEVYTITSKVTSDQILPDGTAQVFEADVKMKVIDIT